MNRGTAHRNSKNHATLGIVLKILPMKKYVVFYLHSGNLLISETEVTHRHAHCVVDPQTGPQVYLGQIKNIFKSLRATHSIWYLSHPKYLVFGIWQHWSDVAAAARVF